MTNCEAYKSLGLKDSEYQIILDILKREPSLTELAMFSVEWSEHCGYPSSRKLIKMFPKKGKYEVFIAEDSGGIILDGLAIVFKIESHNHPSQVEPKQGSATGVGGIIRDIFTAGARPIASLNSLRFGPLEESYNRYLLKGVVEGIAFYGNCLGVPTVGGEIYFEENYSGNCLVNAMSIGIVERDSLIRAKAYGLGNSIIYAGSSTGRDGIGGCSVLASNEFKESAQMRDAVQIGDPFTEKCLIEATLEAIATGHVLGIKDMGAAGLTCCSSEMASSGGVGMEIELQAVPRREPGMQPWEVMMSESQEREILCVRSGKEREVQDIFTKWGVQSSVIGKVTDDGIVRIKDSGAVVAEVKASSLTEAPVYEMPYQKPDYLEKINNIDTAAIEIPEDYNVVLKKILDSPSVGSKAWVYEQYDHMVQTNTVILPGSDASVIRIKGTDKAIAAVTDCNSRYCYLNPYRGAAIAVAEAARNLSCVGAEPAAVTDCLNFGNPEKPDRFWQFKNCVKGIADACRFFNLPVVSGNVSFYNENPKGAIFPTPVIGMLGVINDIGKICSQNFKKEKDLVILLGISMEEFGGTEYLKQLKNITAGDAPKLDLELEKSVQDTVRDLISKGLINSAHDCSEGGLAVALSESCVSGRENVIGAYIDNLDFNIRPDAVLFGESQSRVIISCSQSEVDKIKEIARLNKVPCRIIGETGGRSLTVTEGAKKLIDMPIEDIYKIWSRALERRL